MPRYALTLGTGDPVRPTLAPDEVEALFRCSEVGKKLAERGLLYCTSSMTFEIP